MVRLSPSRVYRHVIINLAGDSETDGEFGITRKPEGGLGTKGEIEEEVSPMGKSGGEHGTISKTEEINCVMGNDVNMM